MVPTYIYQTTNSRKEGDLKERLMSLIWFTTGTLAGIVFWEAFNYIGERARVRSFHNLLERSPSPKLRRTPKAFAPDQPKTLLEVFTGEKGDPQ